MRKILTVLMVFATLLFVSCAMESRPNNSIGSPSNTSCGTILDKSVLSRGFVINFSETQAAQASGVQGPGLANGNFGSPWSGNGNSGDGCGNYTYIPTETECFGDSSR